MPSTRLPPIASAPTPAALPTEPQRQLPGSEWPHRELYDGVRKAIRALQFYFDTETVIEGLNATDIFTLNTALGATIEEQVVVTLNKMRPLWDPDERYQSYGFVRQPQTFPDVRLEQESSSGQPQDVVLGIELKGWYILAKEGEPSFRFKVTPAACAPQDLIVVVPWALNNVVAGSPRIFAPYVESARYAAEYKNYYWQHLRTTTADSEIRHPEDAAPYPGKADQISDHPVSDSGGNFGRFARTGIMDAY